jgi:hypothetical protein
MREGVPNEAFTTDALDDLGGLVERQGERIVLTRTGRLMANEVSLRLQAF